MKQKILACLGQIEEEKNVKILYACESGSRAWGFASLDSDFDVRFIYLHPVDWYLSLATKRDVIELPVNEQLDISGWDLQKALLLFRKSNPPLMEWLGSPIVYLDRFSVASQIRSLASEYYSPIACAYHYLHMAQGNNRGYLKGEQVWLKKYFYVLRPILAVQWIEQGLGVIPTEFGVLVNQLISDPVLKKEIAALVQAKQNGAELDSGPRIEAISDFIEQELIRFEQFDIDPVKYAAPIKRLDELFLAALAEVWK